MLWQVKLIKYLELIPRIWQHFTKMHEWLRFKDMSAERKEGHHYVSISDRVPAGSANRFMKVEPSLARIWRCLSEVLSIKDNPSHTLHCTTLLRQHHSFSLRVIKPCCQEKRFSESLHTFSVRLYTNFFLWQECLLFTNRTYLLDLWATHLCKSRGCSPVSDRWQVCSPVSDRLQVCSPVSYKGTGLFIVV